MIANYANLWYNYSQINNKEKSDDMMKQCAKTKGKHMNSIVIKLEELIFGKFPEQEEDRKTVLILRTNSVIMCIYFLVLLLAFFGLANLFLPACAMPCFIAYLFLFYLSYQNRAGAALVFHNIISMVFVVLFVYMYGWDSGVQHFIFAAVVMSFMAGTGSVRKKLLYVIFLCLMRLVLYFYTSKYLPVIEVTAFMGAYFQIINTIAIFTSMVSCLLISGAETERMKNRLMISEAQNKADGRSDPLTGLPNQEYILEYLAKTSEKAKDTRLKTVSVALCSMDSLHTDEGNIDENNKDMLMRQAAWQLDKFMEDKGRTGQWNDHLFLLVFDDMMGEDAYYYLSCFQNMLRSTTYKEGNILSTMTFGLAEYDLDQNAENNISEVEKKLRLGVQSGGNTIVF